MLSAHVYSCCTVLTCDHLTFRPWREHSAALKYKHRPLLSDGVCAVSGKAVCLNCDWHFTKGYILKSVSDGDGGNAICKCQITGKIFKFFMLLSRPLISAFRLHSGERNTVNVQGWILKFKKWRSFLFPLWLISFRISGERSCFCASGLFLVASSAAAWRCRRGDFRRWWRSRRLLSREVCEV